MKAAKSNISPKEKAPSSAEESATWTLTSGKRLEDFAEQGGYLAPLLLMTGSVPGLGDWVSKLD